MEGGLCRDCSPHGTYIHEWQKENPRNRIQITTTIKRMPGLLTNRAGTTRYPNAREKIEKLNENS